MATAALDPSQSTLSPNFSSYVYDMLGKGQGLANLPFQEYTGQRFAGPSALQQQAFSGIASLNPVPGQFSTATDLVTGAGQRAGQMSYTPTNFQGAGTFQPGQVTTGLGPVGSVQSYMNPYTSAVTDPTIREMRRQADISATQRGAKFAQAGAFGGARQAIENAEAERNLQQQIGDVYGRGLQGAYDRALGQRSQESQLGLTAQQLTEQGRQFGANLGMDAAKLGETSRQFGANFGLEALRQQLASGQALGGLGTQQSGTQLQGLQALLSAGNQQQQLAQQPLDFGYQQYQESMKYPFQQATFMQSLLQGLPLQARAFDEGQTGLSAAFNGGLSGLALYNLLNPNTSNPTRQ